MNRHSKPFAAAALAFGLAACEPGEDNMADALRAHQGTRGQVAAMLMIEPGKYRGMPLDRAVDDLMSAAQVEKSSCVEAQGAPGYMCDFRVGFPQPDGRVSFTPQVKGRFFKGGNGWSVETNMR